MNLEACETPNEMKISFINTEKLRVLKNVTQYGRDGKYLIARGRTP